jgi:alpha-D-xyloside xylohydrolase
MAGSLRGGLHFGVSGFAFWSHDIPGFHGVPHFINTWPADDLYIRWTQFGVFTSHMRYHGAQPREPYEYPAIADMIRKWWRLRYALIPYFLDEARAACRSGFPILRAMLLHHPDDPQCWHIDNQFFCGSKLLVAPVMSSDGVRDVYLPAGEWVDFWTGKVIQGPVWLKNIKSPLGRLPVYAMINSHIKIYPEPVQSTDAMNMRRCAVIKFDKSYKGFGKSAFGKFIDL